MLKRWILVFLAACGGGNSNNDHPDAPPGDARPPGDAALPDGGGEQPTGCALRGFPSLSPIPEVFEPSVIGIADANKDGIPDLFTSTAGGLRLRLGKGDHTFDAGTLLPIDGVSVLRFVDVNGDGLADAVTLANGVPGVDLARRDGTFAGRTAFPIAAVSDELDLADVDGNGKPDLVMFARGERKLTVLFNQGNGTFSSERVTTFSTVVAFLSFAVGDVTGDGTPDAVIADESSNKILVLDGKADGTFAAPRAFDANLGPKRVALADLDKDGKLDVIAQGLTSGIGVLRNTGGTLAAPVVYFTGSTATGLAIADLDADGKLDVITTDLINHTVNVLRGNGDGTLADRVLWPAGKSPSGLAVGDVTGDGALDLVIADGGFLRSTFILEGNGDGTFRTERSYPAATPDVVLTADFNKDGITDLATVTARGVVSVLLGNADGTFQPKRDSPAAGFARSAAIADFNGDGKLDLAVPQSGVNFPGIAVLFGNGDGTFQDPRSFPTGGQPTLVATGDLDGDGITDLLALGGTNSGTLWSVLHGNGDGTFGQHFDIDTPSGGGLLQITDITGDGHADAVLVGDSAVKVLAGDGHGGLADAVSYATPQFTFGMVIRDVDGDGRLDVVTTSQNATLSVLRGQADGKLAARVDTPIGPDRTRTTGLVLFDATGDGVPDAITVNTDINALTIVTGNRDGTFGAASHYIVRDEPVGVVAGDFNKDGYADFGVIHSESGAGTVGVVLGSCLR